MSFALMIPAAGQGERMGKSVKKQYINLKGSPLVTRTLNSFAGCAELFDQVILLIPENDHNYVREKVLSGVAKKIRDKIELIAGGDSRRETVKKGLDSLNSSSDYVIIHDGARPFIDCKLVKRIIEEVKKSGAVSVGTPVKDTIKVKNEAGLVERTLDRDKLIAIQTPQAFSCEIIKKAHGEIKSEEKAPDDACLVEKMGHKVAIIRGDYDNIKITTPFDLKIAEFLLETREAN